MGEEEWVGNAERDGTDEEGEIEREGGGGRRDIEKDREKM